MKDFTSMVPSFSTIAHTQLFPNQKYYFQKDDRGLAVWARTLCVLDDIKEFHDILAEEHVYMQIDHALVVSFNSEGVAEKGPTNSRICKKMWDTPSVRAVLDDFQIECWNFYAQRQVK